MKLHLTASEQVFVDEVAEFLQSHWDVSAALLPAPRRWAAQRSYFKALAARGWLVGQWPKAFGGLAWSDRERWLWEREAARVGAPQPSPHGPDLLGPLLLREGSAVQKNAHLPGIASGEVRWCQALGEDSGGIDLDAVTTVAQRVGGRWKLTGEKPWVLDVASSRPPAPSGSAAGAAPFTQGPYGEVSLGLYVLARTGPPVEAGSTPQLDLFLVPVPGVGPVSGQATGMSIEPRRMIGESPGESMVAVVRFTNLDLGAEARLGEPGSGARLAREIEQAQLAASGSVARNRVLYEGLQEFVAEGAWDGGSLRSDEDYLAKLHGVEVELAALEALEARAAAPTATPEFRRAARLALAASVAEVSQTLTDLRLEALGYFALPMADFTALDNEGSIGPEFAQPALLGMLSDRARGAISAPPEHLRNFIAKSVLALPDGALSPRRVPRLQPQKLLQPDTQPDSTHNKHN